VKMRAAKTPAMKTRALEMRSARRMPLFIGFFGKRWLGLWSWTQRSRNWRRRCWSGGSHGGLWFSRDFGDDFFCGGFADGAGGIPDSALRESEFAAARAGVRVEAVEDDLFFFGREFREIDARKLGGAIGVREKDFALVLEGFDFGHDGHAEEGANFRFINRRTPEADVLLHDAAGGVQDERSGQGGDAAELYADVIGSHGHGIVDAGFLDVLLNIGLFVVDVEADDLETAFVTVLQSDEIGNFCAARSAPGGPEIQEHNFAFEGGDGKRLAVERREFEVGSRIGVADEADDGLVVWRRGHLCTGQSRCKEKKPCRK
jgi:hypothetical protein